MTFPFTITEEIRHAWQEYQNYISAGSQWLQTYDSSGEQTQLRLDAIQQALHAAAEQHFGNDEDAYDEFSEDYSTTDDWFDILEEIFDKE